MDEIHNAFLRNLPERALLEVLSCFNQLWAERSFPPSWRESIVVPILKQGKDKSDPNNYRPISLTSCLCKVMERMVNRRLVWWLERRNLLSTVQCGFPRGRSTVDHLVRTENYIQEAFVLRQHVVGIFFDLEKAYDRVWRRKILLTLHKWGFRGHLPIFIENFLKNRTFKVRIGRDVSQSYSLENGVPQGSVLSVTLFAIAVNDVADCVKPPTMSSLFVDDLAIFCRSSKLVSVARQLQLALNNLGNWSRINGFKFSAEKTKCVHFHRKRGYFAPPALKLDGRPLPYVESARFLGMTLDHRLNWREHIQFLRNNCLRTLNILKFLTHSSWGADRSMMLLLYRALVRSRLDYGSFIYSSGRESILRTLTTLHNTGLRLSTGAFRTSPVLSIYADAGEPPLQSRRNILMLNYAAKILASRGHPCFNIVFNPKFLRIFIIRTRATKPLCIRLKEFIEASGIQLPDVAPIVYPDIPPWIIPHPKIYEAFKGLQKEYSTTSEYQYHFNEFVSRHKDSRLVYTDGSKSEAACACAVSSAYHGIMQTRLSPLCSIYTAELIAIKMALRMVAGVCNRSTIICTDSKSSLQSIATIFPTHPIVQDIQIALYNICKRGREVSFLWVPGHMGIRGNEKADAAAKAALTLVAQATASVTYQDLQTAMRRIVLRQWSEVWTNVTNNKLRMIKPVTSVWSSSVGRNRREEVIITRLRIGHCALTHSYLFTEEKIPPRCGYCGCHLTVRHLLTECDEHQLTRDRTGVRGNLECILGDDSGRLCRVIEFVKKSGLANSI